MTTTDPKPNDVYTDELGCAWTVVGVHERPSVVLENKLGERIAPTIDSPMFQAMRTRSPSPDPVPLRVEPPEEFAGEENHWLFTGRSGRDEFVLREWGWSEENQDRAWLVAGVAREYTPEEIAAKGWSWHSVASPCKPDTRIEPTDEAIEALFNESLKRSLKIAGLDLTNSYMVQSGHICEFARALLAKQTPTITKDQWDQLYSLAKTRAPEHFRTEAKALLGGGV